jgi:hypothetical protein
MGHLSDNTPLTNILTIAVAAAVGVGAWFLLWRLVDLLPAKLKQRAARDGSIEISSTGSGDSPDAGYSADSSSTGFGDSSDAGSSSSC